MSPLTTMQKIEKTPPPIKKAVLSPSEFAALFGRHYTWAYRQIRARKVRVVTDIGRMLIPRSEVDRILNQVPERPAAQNPPPEISHDTTADEPARPGVLVSVAETSSEHIVAVKATTSPAEPLWTTKQVADFLQVHAKTIFNLRKSGLPHIYLGGTVRFVPQSVRDYLAANPNLSLHRLRQMIRRKNKSS